MDIANLRVGSMRTKPIADRLDEVGLAQTHAPIDEERVVGSTGPLGHLGRRGTRQLVRFARHESFEGECRVEPGNLAAARLGGCRLGGACGSYVRGGFLLLFRQEQLDLDAALEVLPRERLDPLRELVSNPLLYEAVGRDQRDRIALRVTLERLDPGSKLLGGKFLLE